MAKLADLIGTKEVRTSDPEVRIVVALDLTWSDWLANRAIEDEEQRGVDAFMRLIRDWDLEDEDGQKLPVTEENVRKLPTSIAIQLLGVLNEQILERSKKKAS